MQVLVFVSIMLFVLGVGHLALKKPLIIMYIVGGVGLFVFMYGVWLLSSAIITAF